jgi:hypothetical protein
MRFCYCLVNDGFAYAYSTKLLKECTKSTERLRELCTLCAFFEYLCASVFDGGKINFRKQVAIFLDIFLSQKG